MAPGEINADVEQSIGTSTRTREFHDCRDRIGLAGDERHWLSGDMVWRGIDAKNQIAGPDSIAHGFHPLRRQAA